MRFRLDTAVGCCAKAVLIFKTLSRCGTAHIDVQRLTTVLIATLHLMTPDVQPSATGHDYMNALTKEDAPG